MWKQLELLLGLRWFRDEDKAFLIAVNQGIEGIGWVAQVDLDPIALTYLWFQSKDQITMYLT